eukprot:gene3794-6955_t
MSKLWGDNYYDSKTKKWTKNPKTKDGEELPRGFCHFILGPIQKLFKCSQSKDLKTLEKLLSKIGIEITSEQKKLPEKILFMTIMQQFLPISDSISEMMVIHLPSAKISQALRFRDIYTGDLKDIYAKGIQSCDPQAPLMVYISKMVPSNEKSKYMAFGRVFSGTLKSNSKITILGKSYCPGKKEDLWESKSMIEILLPTRIFEDLDEIPFGNFCVISGIDQYILNQVTIIDVHSTIKFARVCEEFKNIVHAIPDVQIACEDSAEIVFHNLADATKRNPKKFIEK